MADNDHYKRLIARLTDRLAGDPELQADVARELQTHLEDAADEYRDAGLDEDKAQQEAVRAMGDPEEISQQLWQANRSRMRFRAIARWAASLAILPAAVVVIVSLVFHLSGGKPLGYPYLVPTRWTRHLTEEQVYILQGDPQAKDFVARAKSITDRWPDNPIYYGDYFVACQEKFYREKDQLPPGLWNERMALAEHGEKVDPDNAFYNFVKAGWLIDASCTLKDDPSRQFESMDTNGEIKPGTLYKITITDPVRFQQGLEEFRRGLEKPIYSSRTVEMLELRMSFLPPPQSLTDILNRITMQVSTLFPSLNNLRILSKALGAYAMDQAEKGDASAVDLARSVEQMSDMIGAESGTLIELLVAMAVRQITLANMELIGKDLHNQLLADEAFRQRRRQEEFWQDLKNTPCMDMRELRHAGMFWSILMPGIAGYRVEFEPLRTVECFVVLEVALLILLVGVVLLSCGFGLAILIWAIFCRRSANKPVLLFVGWRRIGRIVLVSIVLPLVVFGLYVSWQIFRPDAYGLNYTLGRWMVELVVLLCAVFFLLLSMSYRAIRQRCLEIDLPTPPAITLRKRIIVFLTSILLLLLCVVYIVGWWAGPFRKDNAWLSPFLQPFGENKEIFPFTFIEVVLLVLLLAFLIAWLGREGISLLCHRQVQFRRTFIRSTMPILCSSVIVVGLAVGSVLSLGERYAARRVTGNAAMSLQAEIERSGFRLMREKFIQWRQEDGKQAAGSGKQ